jgi:sec-independent protein translocase protein TatC
MKGDDLFEKSSMTFGEHLEELRIALVKSSIWLGLGMILGLMLATQVVTYMQGPLEKSLENFYKKKSLREMAASSGTPVPADLETWMKDNKVVSQYVWIDPQRLSFKNLPAPTDPAPTDPAPAVAEAPVTASNNSPIVAQYMADADSEGLPDPSKMIKLRMFVGVKASTEALGLQEPFMIWLKAAFVVAAVVASPGIFYHLSTSYWTSTPIWVSGPPLD